MDQKYLTSTQDIVLGGDDAERGARSRRAARDCKVKKERSGTVVAQRGVLKGISGSLDGKDNDEGRRTRGRQTEWRSMESDEAMAIE
jgi:hypothetical protein